MCFFLGLSNTDISSLFYSCNKVTNNRIENFDCSDDNDNDCSDDNTIGNSCSIGNVIRLYYFSVSAPGNKLIYAHVFEWVKC